MQLNDRVKLFIFAVAICVIFLLVANNRRHELSLLTAGGNTNGLLQTSDQSKGKTASLSASTKRVETLGYLAGNSPMLISDESESGVITNIYQFPSGKLIKEEIAPNPRLPLFGSDEYEILARQDYMKSSVVETNLLEIKEIFEDFSRARQSKYLYSGIREAYILRAKIYKLQNSDLLLSAQEDLRRNEIWSVSDPIERELKTTEVRKRVDEESWKIWLDKADAPNRFKQRMERLYGEFPKSIFQRVMSIEINTEPEDLIQP